MNDDTRLDCLDMEDNRMNTNTCKWHLEKKDGYNLEEHDYWETSCDNLFQYSVDQNIVDCFKFCPFCSRLIVEEECKNENNSANTRPVHSD